MRRHPEARDSHALGWSRYRTAGLRDSRVHLSLNTVHTALLSIWCLTGTGPKLLLLACSTGQQKKHNLRGSDGHNTVISLFIRPQANRFICSCV